MPHIERADAASNPPSPGFLVFLPSSSSLTFNAMISSLSNQFAVYRTTQKNKRQRLSIEILQLILNGKNHEDT